MEKDLNNSGIHNTSSKTEEDNEKSFVDKFKSIITNTPLSKWFRKLDDSSSKSTIRRRNDDAEDDEICQMQPPSKRVKFPSADETHHFNNTSNLANVDVNKTSQKSNHFPEPVAGPSGIKTRKLLSNVSTSVSTSRVKNNYSNSEMLNGHKDSDSEESTSGYSSVPRIGSKDNVCHSQESSKQTSPLQSLNYSRSLFQNPNTSTNRSLFTDSTLSSSVITSMTTRRPTFNASTFGSPNFIDKTIATEKIINSPFYCGRTIYGGASAYGRRLGRSARDLRNSLKRPVQIKPVNKTSDSGNLTLGKTARRILETLEQYSSPINDAKKIPVASKRFKSDGFLSTHVGASPYLRKGGDTPSKKELQVPTVSDLLKMKQKTRLQTSTETVRQIAISSKSDLNCKQSEKKLTSESRNKTDVLQQQKNNKPILECVDLTSPSLPATKLPKFDSFKPPQSVDIPLNNKPSKVAPPQATIINTHPKVTIETEKNVQKESSGAVTFRFSAPLVIAENMRSIVAINNFKFSKPLDNLKKSDTSPVAKNKKSLEMKTKTMPIPVKEQEINTGVVKSKGVGIKSADQWECTVCMVLNDDKVSKCVCCTASKPSGQKTEVAPLAPVNNIQSSFGDKFKLPTSMWECSVCMVRNENSKTKCSACETPNHKAVFKEKSTSNGISLMAKFQPPASTWECTACLIRNKNEVVKCAACESPRIGSPKVSNSLSASFKKKDDEWECQVCMVRNKTTNVKCQCCESLKPGSNPKNNLALASENKPIPKFNFGIDKAAAASFSFGVPSSTVSTLPKPEVDPAAIFGENAKKTIPAASFTFGVKPDMPSTKTTLLVPPKNAETNNVTKPVGKTDASTPVTGFQFGTVTPTTTQSTSLTSSKVEAAVKTVAVTTASAEAPKPMFNFSVVPSSSDKVTNKTDTTAKDTFKTPPAKLFSFGSKPSVTTAVVTPVGTPASGMTPNQSAPVSQAPVVVTSQNAISKPGFSFGVSKTSADSSSSSIFGANTTAPNNGFPAASFGSPKASVTPGLSSNSDVNASPIPSFGSTTNTFGSTANTFGSTNNSFGNASKPSFKAPSFSFGGTAAASEPPSKAPMFSFGQSAGSAVASRVSQPAAPPTGFDMSFGASNAGSPSFNFTVPKTTAAPPALGGPASNIFGSTGPNNVEATSRMFNFGASAQNNTQKAGFSFGAPVDNKAASVPAQPGFNFGAATPAPKPVGGFNFSVAANFDGSVKPSFNFSDAPVTSFTAQPSAESGAAPQRKIKRAVRRTQR